MSRKSNNYFWLSYADLMTSLFFIMLVLFVLVVSIMQYQQGKLIDKIEEYEKIKEIKDAINSLNSTYFKYDEINKRHELKVNVLFKSGVPAIPNDKKLREDLYNAGLELANIVSIIPKHDDKIKYLVIIEGMAARYNTPSLKWRNRDVNYIESTYILSYNRAKSLYQFWQSKGIVFDENVFEIVLAGSGWYGAGRYSGGQEGENKRFLIQIIPKVGEIKSKDD
jgi:hypothetical protein